MPRPHRCRFIDSYPDHWSFAALDDPSSDTVIMSLDEYETIRLLDKEGPVSYTHLTLPTILLV